MEKPNVTPNFVIIPEDKFNEIESKISDLHELKKVEVKLKDIISKDAACKQMGIGEATWYRLRSSGKLKVYKLGNKQYIKMSELESTLQEGLVGW